MVHATLLALTGLAASAIATAYKHTSMDRMKCATAITQDSDANYPTCTSPSKLDCFCAQPFDPRRVSNAAREVCEGVGIPTEYIPNFICRDHDSDRDGDSDGRYEVHRHDHTCHHAVYYDDDDDDDDSDSNNGSDGNRDIHRISRPMMRVSAPGSEIMTSSAAAAAKHTPNGQVQSKRAYAPGLSPSASSSVSAHRALVTDASSSPSSKTESEGDSDNENEYGESAGRVITEIHTYTSCDCSSTVAAAVASGRPSESPSMHLHQGAIPVSSSSTLAGAHSHGPASMYVSVPVSVPTGVDAQRSGYPSFSDQMKMASSSGVPSASASPSPSVVTYDVDDGAVVGVFMPSSVVMVGLTAIMAFLM